MRIEKYLISYLQNLPGIKTNRKIVVIESDDWGSIRMPSRKVYDQLFKKGYKVDLDPYMKYDCMANSNDLEALFEVLSSVQDKNGRNAIITANTIMANPDFEKIMPKETNISIETDKEEMLRAVRLASVFARDSANIVKFIVKKDKITLTAESSHAGDQKTDVDAKIEGGEIEIAFNYKFLEDFLHSVKGESVKICLSNPNAPGLFTDINDPAYLHLIMPVRIQL